MALNGRGGVPKNSTDIQLVQKIANASTRYDTTGRRPTNDITPDPNRRRPGGSSGAISPVMTLPSSVEEQ
jgi:hypothetical protein